MRSSALHAPNTKCAVNGQKITLSYDEPVFPPHKHVTESPSEWGPYIAMADGRRFHFLRDTIDEIDINHIAHNLSGINRYTASLPKGYTVGQHSLLVSTVVARLSPQFALEALLHDASEAYMNDMSAPLKSLLKDYRSIETHVEARIAKRFNLRYPWPAPVNVGDLMLLRLEMNSFIAGGTKTLEAKTRSIVDALPPLKIDDEIQRVFLMTRDEVVEAFTQRFMELSCEAARQNRSASRTTESSRGAKKQSRAGDSRCL